MASTGPIQKSDDVMGGTPVFSGTRVPVRTLIDYLEGGDNVNQFLNDFPTVSKELVKLLLKGTLTEEDLHPYYLVTPEVSPSAKKHRSAIPMAVRIFQPP